MIPIEISFLITLLLANAKFIEVVSYFSGNKKDKDKIVVVKKDNGSISITGNLPVSSKDKIEKVIKGDGIRVSIKAGNVDPCMSGDGK